MHIRLRHYYAHSGVTPCFNCYEKEKGRSRSWGREKYLSLDMSNKKCPTKKDCGPILYCLFPIQFRAILKVLEVQEHRKEPMRRTARKR